MTTAFPPHSAIPADVHAEIMRRLQRAEAEHGVRILLAVESGSRAWGFASPDSDYDVRFIYVHPPRWYQAVDLEEKRDVIEYPIVDDIDLNGWDVRKALRLMRKSNPAFVEWIQSPIRYLESGIFAAEARRLLPEAYSVANGLYHYRSMAKTNFRTHLTGEQVRLKKYFYSLRPLLATLWLERYATPAPIEFEALLHLIDDRPSLLADIHDLQARKRVAPETWVGDAVPSLNAFIEQELARLDGLQAEAEGRGTVLPALNALFHRVLDESGD